MSVDTLSDSELRSKLAEYGYPVGPVTQTTRKILVKKLKNLIEARDAGFKGSGRHSLAAKYSSDDTDDDNSSASRIMKKKSNNSRRQTMANPMPPPAPAVVPKTPSRRRTGSRTNSHDSSEPYVRVEQPLNTSTKSVKTTTSTRKVTRNFKSSNSNDGLETGSDSDITEDAEKSYAATKYKFNEGKSYDLKNTAPSSITNERHVPTIIDYEPISKPFETKKRSIFTTSEDNYVAPAFKLNISPIQAQKDDIYNKVDDPLANVQTPYLSDFTRRLSRISTTNLPSRSSVGSPILRHSPALPEVKESDSNGHFSSLRSKYLPSTSSSRYNVVASERPVVTRTFPLSTDGKEMKNNPNLISFILIGVLVLFFLGLAVGYLGLGGRSDSLSTGVDDNIFPFCSTDVPNANKPGVNCVAKGTEVTTMQLLRKLQSILTEKAINYNCDDTTDVPYMTDANVIDKFLRNDLDQSELQEDLYNAQLLIFNNPKFGISLIEIDEFNKASSDNQIINNWKQVLARRDDGKIGMVVLNPDVPMTCLVKNKLYTLLTSLLAVAVGCLIFIGGHKLLLWHLRQKKESENEVFRLVSEIISMLELHHQNSAVASPGGTQESYLAINHVRDNLILPKDRKKMSAVWTKAVKFLDENESRVRREVQQVAGEEFHVWRWLPSNNLNASNAQSGNTVNKKAKVWQGQAFETMEGSVNSLQCSPTPCLKIRHMFDPDVEFEDDWETKVQDAILEKCGEDVKILHICVDCGNREGCVYMKCMSQEDAGKAYRALHGWWFDSKLVTVKYLRLERYHARFPDASRSTIPLKPSNNKRLSMQLHNWQSPMESI